MQRQAKIDVILAMECSDVEKLVLYQELVIEELKVYDCAELFLPALTMRQQLIDASLSEWAARAARNKQVDKQPG